MELFGGRSRGVSDGAETWPWWALALLLPARALFGPALDAVLWLVPAAGLLGRRRVAWRWRGPALACGALALVAGLQLLWPRPGWPPGLEPGLWAGELPALRWSLAPWATQGWLVTLLGLALWAAWLGGARLDRRRAALLLLLALAVVAGESLLRAWTATARPHANQVSGLLALAVPLAFVLTACWRNVLLLLVAAALAWVDSWSGRLLAVAGLLWMLKAVIPPRWRVRLLLSGVLLLAGLGLAAWLAPDSAPAARLQLWWQLGPMLASAGWWGFGFGSFAWLAPVWLHDLPGPAVRALHPENGWIWLWLAGGLPALAALLLALPGVRMHRDRVGQAGRVAAVQALALTLIEVPWLWSPWSLAVVAVVLLGWDWDNQGDAADLLPEFSDAPLVGRDTDLAGGGPDRGTGHDPA